MLPKSGMFGDNNSALAVATMPKITLQSKFFAVKLHFFNEHIFSAFFCPQGEVHIQKNAADKQLADIMTKDLVEGKFIPLRDVLVGWNLDSGELNAHLSERALEKFDWLACHNQSGADQLALKHLPCPDQHS